jgi:hypothetical protein
VPVRFTFCLGRDLWVPLDKVEGFVKAHYSYAVREHR